MCLIMTTQPQILSCLFFVEFHAATQTNTLVLGKRVPIESLVEDDDGKDV